MPQEIPIGRDYLGQCQCHDAITWDSLANSKLEQVESNTTFKRRKWYDGQLVKFDSRTYKWILRSFKSSQ